MGPNCWWRQLKMRKITQKELEKINDFYEKNDGVTILAVHPNEDKVE